MAKVIYAYFQTRDCLRESGKGPGVHGLGLLKKKVVKR
jgi:hypothetical protein